MAMRHVQSRDTEHGADIKEKAHHGLEQWGQEQALANLCMLSTLFSSSGPRSACVPPWNERHGSDASLTATSLPGHRTVCKRGRMTGELREASGRRSPAHFTPHVGTQDGNQGKHRVTKRGPALSYPMFTLVTSKDIAESIILHLTSKCGKMLKSGIHLCLLWFSATILISINHGQRYKQAKSPLLQNRPFIAIWNAPTQQCKQRYKIDLDLTVFDIVVNPNETLSGQNVTIFYHTHLGYYPYVTDDGESVYGGVPQNGSFENHFTKAVQDITSRIPAEDFHGLGVIDWENWRPQWDRNWGIKSIYRNKSMMLVEARHPDWPINLITKQAKEEFDTAARSFMRDSVILAREIRPQGHWGYYLFPDCYNYDYKEDPYTGECPTIEIKRNDYLQWMWEYSSALFPSIYLDYVLQSSSNSKKFVHHRLKEAIRVASMSKRPYELPIYAYARPFYALTLYTLSQLDLIYSN
ncbi:unnamed protein product [Ranitomeya imitator]|uniref:Hyaluronidase n=1 Tax=Ranitomeya imitator TaxID=111125 RepID=A0ABN9LH42_9NEOB|nr:unnamed protein product [Ranitomeya imitator]